jgi:dihydroflavonol-4-reductase
MSMFITGGTSSIGRVLVKQLSQDGLPLRLLVRKNSDRRGLELPNVEFIEGEVNDAEAVRKGMRGCNQVTHMAAIVAYNVPEAEWWRVNRDGSRLVLQTASDLQVESFVQVSSISVLGPTQPGEIADETRPITASRHISLYQKTKFAADEIARQFAAQGLPVKIVYPTFGYGCSHASSHPSMHEQTLLRMAAGKPTAIMGNGKNKLCLAYYRDTVAGIRLAHQQGKPGEGYILGNDNLTFPEIWAVIAGVLGKKPPTRHIPLPLLKTISVISRSLTGKSTFPPDFFEMIELNWCFSNRKARQELGWQPHSFGEGIAETWAEYQSQGWRSDKA